MQVYFLFTMASGAKIPEEQDIRASTVYRLLQRLLQEGFINFTCLFLKKVR